MSSKKLGALLLFSTLSEANSTEKQLCGKGPGGPRGPQAQYEFTVCGCSKERQQDAELHQ